MNQLEQIFDEQFQIIYWGIAFLLLFFLLDIYVRNKYHDKVQNILLLFLSCSFVLLFGMRDVEVGIDTKNTIMYFTNQKEISSLSELKDIGIYIISKLTAVFTNNINVFLTVLATLYIYPMCLAIKRITKHNVLLFFFLFISFFFFKSMGLNTVRQGIAGSFFLLGLTYFMDKRYVGAAVLYIIAFFSHASIIIIIVIFSLSNFFKTLKIPIIVYLFATLLSLMNFDASFSLSRIPIVNILVENRLLNYYNIEADVYRTGFRLDFFLFNSFFAVVAYITLKNAQKIGLNSNKVIAFYRNIYMTYLLTSSFFFLMFSVAYSDRFGFLSWLFIPLLLQPYTQTRRTIGPFNIFSIYILCLITFVIFNFFI